jgi:cellulose synthase/poly-beta-1,6-N-acetylglucosamine synthase-like glycosyltransferase
MAGELLLYLLAAASGAIVLVHLALAGGVLLNLARDARETPAPAPQSGVPADGNRASPRLSAGFHPDLSVTVVVVAKDEERNLPTLLASLEAQSLRVFQIVLVDDRSRDGTAALMEAFRARHGQRVKVVRNREEPGTRNPKQAALDIAARLADGEVLVFTDADCVVPPQWLAGMLGYFRDPRVGIVFGQISLAAERPGGFLGRFQAFDQPLIHQWNSGTAGLGLPGSCFGNNLAARRAVLEELGGFRSLGDTLTEDAALVTAAAKRRWRVRVSTRRSTMIVTRPQGSWHEFLNQHLRWNTGAFYHQDAATRLPYRFIVLFLTASVLAIPLCPFFPPLAILPATSFIGVGLMGLLAGLLYRRDLAAYLLRLVPYTLFFLGFYSLATVLSMLRRTPEWKGRKPAS